jgi:hypothetical protein
MEFPFTQQSIDGKILRTFSSDVDGEELKWHYDLCDREVLVIQGENWELQKN